MEKLVSKDLYEMHMNFITGIQELGADEATIQLLLLIVLFYPERAAIDAHEYIGSVQDKYLILLNKYGTTDVNSFQGYHGRESNGRDVVFSELEVRAAGSADFPKTSRKTC
jgi:hypothetical protein